MLPPGRSLSFSHLTKNSATDRYAIGALCANRLLSGQPGMFRRWGLPVDRRCSPDASVNGKATLTPAPCPAAGCWQRSARYLRRHDSKQRWERCNFDGLRCLPMPNFRRLHYQWHRWPQSQRIILVRNQWARRFRRVPGRYALTVIASLHVDRRPNSS